jgi:hypothetical protein
MALSKKSRLKYPSTAFSRDDWERAAINYAVWLAEKRGIALPASDPWKGYRHRPTALWAGAQSLTRKAKSGRPIMEQRIWAVSWPCGGPTIELPGWDFQPEVIDLSEIREAA